MEHLCQHFKLILYNLYGLFNALKLLGLIVCVLLEGNVHVLFDTEIINNQSFVLALIDTIDTRNRLNKRVLLNWFVNVDRVQAGYIKPGQPHINYNGNLKVGLHILELPV